MQSSSCFGSAMQGENSNRVEPVLNRLSSYMYLGLLRIRIISGFNPNPGIWSDSDLSKSARISHGLNPPNPRCNPVIRGFWYIYVLAPILAGSQLEPEANISANPFYRASDTILGPTTHTQQLGKHRIWSFNDICWKIGHLFQLTPLPRFIIFLLLKVS